MEVVEPSSPTEEEEEEQSAEPRPRTRSNPEGAEDRALGAQASVGSRSEGEGEASSTDDTVPNPPGAGPKPWQVPPPAPEIQLRTPRVNCPEKVIICLDLSEEMSLPKLESFNGSKTNALNVSQKMIEMFVRTKHKINKSHEFALVVVNDDITWLSGLTSDPRELCSCLYDLETASCSAFSILPGGAASEGGDLEGLFSLIQQKTELPVTENVQTVPPPYVVRTILIYSRPPCQPQFSLTEPMKKMFQCPYFFFDIVSLQNGTDEKEEEISWKEMFAFMGSLDTKGTSYKYEVALAGPALELHNWCGDRGRRAGPRVRTRAPQEIENRRAGLQGSGTCRGMGAGAGLALRLRAALREEEPRAVEELLRRGADPNLVLADGAAAIHLAAGARYPRGLRCLEALLRGGGDPNARSAEALTPLHVAAAWGCRRNLELLLSQGADPELRDQDGLRPLDLAEQQLHQDCACVLRELARRTRTRTPTWTKTQEPEPEPEPEAGGPGPWGPPDVMLDSTGLDGGDSKDMGLEADPESPSLCAHPEVAIKDESSDSPLGHWDSSSDDSFVTAVEASGAEDHISPWAMSLPQTRQGLLSIVQPSQRVPRSPGTPQLVHRAIMAGREAELNACLQALTLTSSTACLSPTSLPDGSPVRSPPQEPLPGSFDFHLLTDDQLSLDSDVAILWLSEDESSTGGRDPVPSCRCRPVPALSDLELLQKLRALGKSCGPITPFTWPRYLRQLEEAKADPGPDFSRYSPELAEALRTGCIPDAQADEDKLVQQFERPDPNRRETQDLPARAFSLTPVECLRTFVHAIFYVGKGTRARPAVHLWEALSHHRQLRKQACPKVHQILDIWASGHGVVSLHCFQHVVAVEAYTREACLVDALGIQTLTNQKQGHCYGVVASWPPARRRRLGVHLLHRALLVFLAEGERELQPQDIQARS
ncbi:hypothetical protein MC885_018185 [Smutsia gigantea]|nr:hypothetical protein MC885_018185 [Smutsia gigantea]